MHLSIAIPAFNRAQELCDLLESLKKQNHSQIEIIICEDYSLERKKIRNKVKQYKTFFPNLKYFENSKNLGYDANLRKCINKSTGDYIVLSGNDDIFADESINVINDKLEKYKPSVLLRSYKSFYKKITKSTKFNIHRYVSKDTLVKVDKNELAWLFYRSVLVSGLVLEKKWAHYYSSDIVDGTLYYQNYLISQISKHGPVLYVPDIIVYNRLLDAADFGHSENEKKYWEPGKRTIKSSVFQMEQFFRCAEISGKKRGLVFGDHLKVIASAYSYPLLRYHRDKGVKEFINYGNSLKKIGYGGIYFYIYQVLLIFFNVNYSLKIINNIKYLFGSTIRIVR